MKAHLLDSDIPILEGSTVTANCGESVPNVVAKFRMTGFADIEVSALLFCAKCRQKLNHSAGRKYLYGILNGQELKHSEI